MSVFFGVQKRESNLGSLIPSRAGSGTGLVTVTPETALRMSAVWAALGLRADILSTFPIDVYRKFGSQQAEVAKPPVLLDPAGDETGLISWLWATQFDLDRVGNCYGIITKTDADDNPREIHLVDHGTVKVKQDKSTGLLSGYDIGGEPYKPSEVWHEKQYTPPGMVMGLSPIAAAAWTIGAYQSAQAFALEWFANGAQVPSGHFKNLKKEMKPEEAIALKERFKAAISDRDVLVTGNDWEYSTIDAAARDAQFIESMDMSNVDIARYIGVPASMIDVNASGQNVTYANLSQDLLRFLVLKLQPAVTRREETFSRRLVSDPRFVKFNTDALLRMDPKTKAEMNEVLLRSKQRTLDEVRDKDNLAPYSAAQKSELEWAASLSSTPTIGEPK